MQGRRIAGIGPRERMPEHDDRMPSTPRIPIPVSKHVKHVPKHRATRPNLADAPRKAIRTTLLLSSVAVAATGATVAGGVLTGAPAQVTNAAADVGGDSVPSADEAIAAEVGERTPSVSRSDTRDRPDPAKAAALDARPDQAMTRTKDLSDADPRDIARALLAEFGFGQDQFGCLDSLYTRESNWRVNADNPTSSAYGIPQALPGSKMASAGADWATNPVTQIRWGLGYIEDRYGSPCGAWAHSQARGWY
jgi:hypothetical protein